jgi:adenylate cyclase
MVRIAYPGRSVEMPFGASVLEASRANGIPHMSLCGGRARCSTCRVRVQGDPHALPAPGHDETRTLQRIGAAPDVRLACQLRPRGPVQVEPLLAPAVVRADHERFPGGHEREVVVMFADLRRWTGLAEEHLPMDLVYVLDRYFETIGDAVREAGGVPNQFIGDSVMALFGVDSDARTGARQALAATEDIARRMALLNEELAPQFGRRLDFGIGIHAGMAAVGSVGYRDTRTLTAVGDAVNTASRLQELTKVLRARVVVSEQVLQGAGQGPQGWAEHEVEVRGRQQRLKVYARDAVSGA